MIIGNFIKGIELKYRNYYFSGICFNSADCKKDNIFFTIKGVKVNGSTLELSKIFEWYGVDFGDSTTDMKNFISYYIKSKTLKQKILNTNKIVYQNYNWNLNGIK